MRILAFAYYYLPDNRGGAERMLHSLLSHLASQGHDVWVGASLGPNEPDVLEIDGVKVVRGLLANDLLDQRWDRVITHLVESTRITRWARLRGIHCTQMVHSDHGWIRLGLSEGPDLAVFNTQWLADEMSYMHDGASMVLHPPVYPERYRVEPGDRVTLVNPLPEKGSGVFYELAARMSRDKFLVVEGGYEIERQVFLKRNNIRFQPSTENMRDDVYAHTRILLMPSSYESYGMTAVEASAAGIPVVAHPTAGLKESLGSAGLFVDRDDVDGWHEAVKALLMDPVLWSEYSQKALNRVGELDTRGEVHRCADAIVGGRS